MKIKLNVQTIKYDGNVVELEYNSWNNRQCTKIINSELNKFINDWVKTTFIWEDAEAKLNRLNEIMNDKYKVDIAEILIHTNKENFSYITLALFYGDKKLEIFSSFFTPDKELFDKITEILEN